MSFLKEAKLSYTQPEIPNGEVLAKRVTYFAMRALTETYPSLLNSPFSEKLPTYDRIRFSSFEEIREQQRKDKPSDASKLLYPGFEAVGIPKPAIEERYHSLDKDDPVYWNRDLANPTMHFSNRFFDNFSSPDRGTRVKEALVFGITLIRETLEMLPIPQELTCQAEWKEMIAIELADFFKSLEKEFPTEIDPEKFAVLKENVDNLPALDPKAYVVSSGAKVSFLFDGQTQNTAEYNMGDRFQDGTVCSLAKDAIRQFIKLMQNAQIAPDTRKLSDFYAYALAPTEAQRFAENILRNTQLVDPNDKNKLFELYLHSDIPTYYHDSKPNGPVNPWQYPR